MLDAATTLNHKKADRLLTNQGTKLEQELTRLEIDNERYTQGETKRADQIEKDINEATGKFLPGQGNAATNRVLDEVMESSGLFDANGELKPGATQEQVTDFQNTMEREVLKVSDSNTGALYEQFMASMPKGASDTQLANAFRGWQELDSLSYGNQTQQEKSRIRQNEAELKQRTNFANNPFLAQFRQDADPTQRMAASRDTAYDVLVEATKDQPEVAKLLGENKEDWLLSDYGPQQVVRAFDNLMVTGVEGSDGKMHTLTPEMLPQLLLGFRDGEGWFSFGTGKINDNDIMRHAKKIVDSPSYKKQEEQANQYISNINSVRYPPSATEKRLDRLGSLSGLAPEIPDPVDASQPGYFKTFADTIQKFGGR